MFELTRAKWKLLTSQIGIFEKGQGKGKVPKVFINGCGVFFK